MGTRRLGLQLNISLLDELMESQTPIPATEKIDENGPAMEELVRCYLPWGSRSGKLVDNVKVSMLVEGVLRGFLVLGAVNGRCVGGSKQDVAKALEHGILRRRGKGGAERAKSGGKKVVEERQACKLLEELEGRLRSCVMIGWDGGGQEEIAGHNRIESS